MRRRDFGSVIVGALAGLFGWRPKRQEVVKSDLESTIKWIDVDERLPELKGRLRGRKYSKRSESDEVLVFARGSVKMGSLWDESGHGDGSKLIWLDEGSYPIFYVTHWAELPKPPKEDR